MPVCSVAPSGMKRRACSAIARSTSVGSASGSANGVASDSTSTSISSTWSACGGRAAGRACAGSRGETSTTSSRSGSAPARCSSRQRAAGVQREAAPAVGVGRRGDRGHHPRRAAARAAASKRRKSAGAKLMLAPWSRSSRSIGPKKPRQVVDVRVVEHLAYQASEQRAVDAQVLPVVALAERLQERGRLAGAERDPERVGRLEQGGGLLRADRLRHCGRPNGCRRGLARSPARMISRWRCQVSAGAPGAVRTARPMPQISPGTSQGSVSARSLPSAFARTMSAVVMSSRPTASAAWPHISAVLLHRLGQQAVLGHHLGRVGHEVDEALPAVRGLQRPAPFRREALEADLSERLEEVSLVGKWR